MISSQMINHVRIKIWQQNSVAASRNCPEGKVDFQLPSAIAVIERHIFNLVSLPLFLSY